MIFDKDKYSVDLYSLKKLHYRCRCTYVKYIYNEICGGFFLLKIFYSVRNYCDFTNFLMFEHFVINQILLRFSSPTSFLGTIKVQI